MTPCCNPWTRGVSVLTTIPSETGHRAGRHWLALPFDLDQAHPADSRRIQLGVVTKDRDLDVGVLGRLDEQHALGHLRLPAVDGNRNQLLTHAERTSIECMPQAFPETWALNSSAK